MDSIRENRETLKGVSKFQTVSPTEMKVKQAYVTYGEIPPY